MALVKNGLMSDLSQLRALATQALESGDRDKMAEAVRQSLDWFAELHPGRAVEVRVPPFRVVQILGGTTHRRGTPPAIVEMRPDIWLKLITGQTAWNAEVAHGSISASGERSDLGDIIATSLSV